MAVEEHYVIGGLGTAVQETLCEEDLSSLASPVKVKKLGIPHVYATSGPYKELMQWYGLDAPGIAGSVEAFLKRDDSA